MEQDSSQILHFHVTSVEETDGNSNRMEKQGLVSVLKKFNQENVSMESITTDRHRKYESTSVKILIYDISSISGMLQKAYDRSLQMQQN